MTAFDFWNILCSIPKTMRFNLHYFPLKTALKLPVFVSHRTFLRELHGQVVIPEQVETAMIRIGFGDVGHYDRKRSRSIWQVSGTVSFGGKASIGHDCLVGWDTLMMDTDEHPLYDRDGVRINPDKPIRLGDHVWIGCKCTLLKGASVPSRCVVAAGTLLKRAFDGEDQVIGGNPPAVIREEVRWEHQ